MFCPECGSILRPKEKAGKKILFCSCGYTKSLAKGEASPQIKETVDAAKKIEVIEKLDTNPKIRITCEKCGHGVAYYWTQQTRGADEPETRFFKCEECSYTWREYA
ncbi:MAG TPA: transcription factor S [Candidatus Nanoarchaeia archaeon]|nr:transcription factor S [Candidatus Nanoarchaeia archaeon]